jgi:predicted acetyltransferase
MLQLYLYDLSTFEGIDLSLEGEFTYDHLNSYWEEMGRHPFFIPVAGQLAGFALVNACCEREGSDFSMAEFFVMKRYRRMGVGKRAASQIFGKFAGVWEVGPLTDNSSAAVFWQKVISAYMAGDFQETIKADGGPLMIFDNTDRAGPNTPCSCCVTLGGCSRHGSPERQQW